MTRVGQNHIYTVYIRYFGFEITKSTVYIYVYIRFWPTLLMTLFVSNCIFVCTCEHTWLLLWAWTLWFWYAICMYLRLVVLLFFINFLWWHVCFCWCCVQNCFLSVPALFALCLHCVRLWALEHVL
jgi:hypothetical protein